MGQFIAFRPFPSFSVTGGSCSLMCDHCRAVHLRGMVDATDPTSLPTEGGGILLSGGCRPDGSVPLEGHLDAVRRMSGHMHVALHTGLVDDASARAIAESGADRVLLDLMLDADVIRDVFHLDRGPEDYLRSLDSLLDAGADVVPHVLVGLGSRESESRALREAAKRVRNVVIIAHMPTRGTPMEGSVTDAGRVVEVVREAVGMFDAVSLGCMRPRGGTLEVDCLRAGVIGIANPSRRTVQEARGMGLTVVERRTCCAYA